MTAGATVLKPATLADWGGTSGYFADPDGHPWEKIAHNPAFPIDEDGRVRIPVSARHAAEITAACPKPVRVGVGALAGTLDRCQSSASHNGWSAAASPSAK